MAGSMVSAATGALGSVLEKLAGMLGGACARLVGVRGEVMFLKAELEHMGAFLVRLSRVEDPDEQARCWMAEVRELSYDVEDSVDEFALCVDDGSAAQLPGFRGFIDRSINLLTSFDTRRRLATEIHRLKDRVREAGERRARYKIDDGVCSQTTGVVAVDPRLCSLYNDVSQLVGIDEPMKELIGLLKEGGNTSAKQLKVVSIVGFGGMGKTTLANQIYHTFGEQFKYRAFVSVSRNPDVMKVLRGILSQLSKQEYSSTESGDERQLIDNILDFLRDKRFFIVVDDVWSVETWEIIKCAIPGNSFGSRVITTTRIKAVAESCSSSHANHVYEVRPLSAVHSKGLFLKRIFSSERQCPPHLNRICDDILKKCGGLPLAIITISGLLANKAQTVDQWAQVQSSIGYALQRYPSVERMIKILSLSYFDLQHDLKTCLLYLSIFPEDYLIEKSRLIRRWIAEGFIQGRSGRTMYELGERCFNELINRSLIQPWHINRYGEVTVCRVHDTILDFIVHKSVEENFVTLLGVPGLTVRPHNKVHRLSLQHKSNGDVLQPNLIYSHVRSLTVFGRSMQIPTLLKSRFLRVLDLEGCHMLAGYLNNISSSFQLKYLSLRNTPITELPEQIGKLQNLETLNLEGTFITELPATIIRLRRLVHLLIDRGVKLPDGTGNMQGLEELKVISLFEQPTSFFQEFGLLTNMRDLSIFWDIPNRNSRSYLGKRRRDQSLFETSDVYLNNAVSSLCKLCTCNLQSLSLDINYGCEDVLQESWHSAAQSLQKLVITGSVIKTVPDWVGSLVNLQQLDVKVEEVRQDDLRIFGSLPGLLHLWLCIGAERGNRSYNVHLKVSSSHGFTCLRNLRIGGKNCGLGLMLETGSLPRLEKLELEFDAIETDSVTNLDLAFGIEHLPCLTSIRCDISSLGEILPSSKTAMAAIERVVSAHPNHPRFEARILG